MKSPYIQHSRRYKRCRLTFWALIICLILLLFGCAKTTPASENAANSAQESLNALEQTIKPECKTKAVESQINAVKSSINAIVTSCESEKAEIVADKIKWKSAFFTTIIIVLIYLVKKVMK